MTPKLKENPKDWLKFTVVVCVVCMLVVKSLGHRGVIRGNLERGLFLVLLAAMFLCIVRPSWFRGFYRAGMTICFYIGQVVSRVLLTILFLLVVTPLGLLLRLFGKDLLQLKRKPAGETYWHRVDRTQNLDRQF